MFHISHKNKRAVSQRASQRAKIENLIAGAYLSRESAAESPVAPGCLRRAVRNVLRERFPLDFGSFALKLTFLRNEATTAADTWRL